VHELSETPPARHVRARVMALVLCCCSRSGATMPLLKKLAAGGGAGVFVVTTSCAIWHARSQPAQLHASSYEHAAPGWTHAAVLRAH
jgi:hypothetical protein